MTGSPPLPFVVGGGDETHRFMHDDGYYYEYPQSPGEAERRKKSNFEKSKKIQGARYERRKKQRAENIDETYNPENDPEVIERRRATTEKEKEQRRKEIAEGKKTKKPANRGKQPPPSVILNASLVIRETPQEGQEVAQEVQGAAQEEQGAQTARVERGGALPPRRQGVALGLLEMHKPKKMLKLKKLVL